MKSFSNRSNPWRKRSTPLLSQGIAAFTLHGRTQRMQSDGRADWGEIAKAARLRDSMGLPTSVIGNGDVLSYEQAMCLCEKHGLDGVMVGRGVFHDPWIFNRDRKAVSVGTRLGLMEKHVRLFQRTWEGSKNFHILKRFFKIYVKGFNGEGALRARVMEAQNYDGIYHIIRRAI